jgi:hypothetical protein
MAAAENPTGDVAATAVAVRAVNIAALDRRHFSVVRPAHSTSFALVP